MVEVGVSEEDRDGPKKSKDPLGDLFENPWPGNSRLNRRNVIISLTTALCAIVGTKIGLFISERNKSNDIKTLDSGIDYYLRSFDELSRNKFKQTIKEIYFETMKEAPQECIKEGEIKIQGGYSFRFDSTYTRTLNLEPLNKLVTFYSLSQTQKSNLINILCKAIESTDEEGMIIENSLNFHTEKKFLKGSLDFFNITYFIQDPQVTFKEE